MVESIDKPAIIGDIAHIFGHGEGSARHDSRLAAQERDSYANWILLCANHHRLVDAQPREYTADLLHRWKVDHERWVASRLSRAEEFAGLEPPAPIAFDVVAFRIGRSERPLWTADRGPPLGRFDDPYMDNRVFYAAASRRGAFLEALSPFRPDAATLARLAEVGSADDDPLDDPAAIPTAWMSKVKLSEARVSARLADLRDPALLDFLVQALRPLLGDVSVADLSFAPVRRITQEASRVLARRRRDGAPLYDGIVYNSRLDPSELNLALWRPSSVTLIRGGPLDRGDPELQAAARFLGLRPPP